MFADSLSFFAPLPLAGKSRMKQFILGLIFISPSITQHIPAQSYLVIWNIGQGQFISDITATTCSHFDMGGEFFPWRKISAQCNYKINRAFLSHWDWDHIGALSKLKNSFLGNLCIAIRPLGFATSKKMKLINSFPVCPAYSTHEMPKIWQPLNKRNSKSKADSNAKSQVMLTRDILLPGDSTTDQEKLWSRLPWIKKTRILVLGHHGSRTSTSQELLVALPNLKMAVSSARWSRYRHPHPLIEARLGQASVALVRTEDWGNIWIE